ncbi:MAG: type II toxin-antitoxin system VapC family toxin [Acidimicrobiia bacterium]
MILIDVNVMVAAHRADHPHHELVHPWFAALTSGDEQFWVPGPVWASFVRITTSRRIFEVPTPVDDAFDFVRAVRAQPNHQAVVPTERHIELFESLCREYDALGDLSADAYVAAMALDLGCTVVSLDRDFARFSRLPWLRPGESSSRPTP